MQYIQVQWNHNNIQYPILLFSEIDDVSRMELRKVELYRNGIIDFADSGRETGKTKLGIVPLPPLEEIACDSQFIPTQITQQELKTSG